jgi:molybdopterin-containing oxidoreductase family membrane subunit
LELLEVTSPYRQTFWWVEILLAGIIPAIILLYPRFRRNDRLLLAGLGLIVVGIVVNRWNVTLSGLIVPPQWSPGVLGNVVAATYFPSWTEVAVSLGVLGYALMAFTLGIRYLPLFPVSSDIPDEEPNTQESLASAVAGD